MKTIKSKCIGLLGTRNGKSGVALIAAMIGFLCLAGLARAGDAITSKVDVVPPKINFSSDEQRALSISAGRILKHVDKALDALADKKNDIASANIEKGLTLVNILDEVLPGTNVRTKIKSAGATYEDEDNIKPTFVSIYREYDQVDVLTPVTAAKQAVGKTATPGAPMTAPEYTNTRINYTGMKLNLRLAKRDLQQAQDLIGKNDIKGATEALSDIQSTGVIFEFNSFDEPLVRAMDNLRLAESELKNNQPGQAKDALEDATDALKYYEKLSSGSRTKEVQKMHQEIDDEAKELAQENAQSFSRKVSDWWIKILSWLSK